MGDTRFGNRILGMAALALVAVSVLLFLSSPSGASDPHSAYYSADNDKVFWFIQVSDVHIGARGGQDSGNLQWVVTEAKNIINPYFIVVSGDLTDSTDGNIFGYPDGPHQVEWDEYKAILQNNVDASFYYDIPGNHDHYNDQYFDYYRANSVQGRATDQTQLSWTSELPFGKYHFLGINTAGNTGSSFTVFPPYGDYAGLDSTELAFINSELQAHSDANLTLIFGHHPLASTGDSSDTYVYYGGTEFISYMDYYASSLYGYGHTHVYSEKFFTQNLTEGVFYFNVASLGKSTSNNYTIMAIDCDGISTVTQTVNAWPAVLITAPMDRYLGGTVNPYAYTVPNGSSNSIRALVFDKNAIITVQYRIDGSSSWFPMARMAEATNPHLWEATWDASALSEGEHNIEVQAATLSGTRSNVVTVYVERQVQPQLEVGAESISTWKYVTTGTKKNKVTTFDPASTFTRGEGVVFEVQIAGQDSRPLANATATIAITGPQPQVLTTGPSNVDGIAEATWQTSKPNKRGIGGTPTGSYTAIITNVTASGYIWDGVQRQVGFSLQ
jgi:hypothetical protein